MRISDWSSDVYSSDLPSGLCRLYAGLWRGRTARRRAGVDRSSGAALLVYGGVRADAAWRRLAALRGGDRFVLRRVGVRAGGCFAQPDRFRSEARSEEHTSELQSLMRISYAVFCLQ